MMNYRKSLEIRESLIATYPENVQWQIETVLLHRSLAMNGDDPARRWATIIRVLRELEAVNKLPPEQAGLLPEAEAQLAELPPN
jgi:hypothetical protein